MMEDNIFQKACLVQLSTSCWQGSRMLDPSVMEQIGNSEWLRGRKHLISPETLNPIRAVISRARKDMERESLPFPVIGLTLAPKEQLSRIEECLEKHRDDYWHEVAKFEDQYEDARETARRNLGELFSDADYPVNIRSRFGFEWRYFVLDVPGKASILTPEIYEREKAKFMAMMEETRDLAMAALRQEFSDHVSHIVERLTRSEDGSPKVFKNCMIQKIQGYLSVFDARNLFGDEHLAELVERAKAIIGGVTPESIRENVWLKNGIAEGMGKIKQAIDQAIIDLPRRKVRLADTSPIHSANPSESTTSIAAVAS
jgi:hypothetical protein